MIAHNAYHPDDGQRQHRTDNPPNQAEAHHGDDGRPGIEVDLIAYDPGLEYVTFDHLRNGHDPDDHQGSGHAATTENGQGYRNAAPDEIAQIGNDGKQRGLNSQQDRELDSPDEEPYGVDYGQDGNYL